MLSSQAFGKQEIILPPFIYNDRDNLDPQMVMLRDPSTGSLDIDSRFGRGEFDNASSVLIATNSNNSNNSPNYLLKDIRRVAIKHLELFFYLDNIIAGYNDTFQMVLELRAPDVPRTEIITVTLTPGVFNLAGIAQNIEDALNAWFLANWLPPPIPVANVAVVPPTLGFPGLLGTLNITVNTFTLSTPFLAVNPASSFIANSPSMLIVSAENTWPVPSVQEININFFSLVPYNYIDIVSDVLTRDSKLLSSTNTSTNYTKVHRIYTPDYGLNKYNYEQPLTWINVSKDNTAYNIDFRFIDSTGQEIKGAITRNFWWLMQLVTEK